MFNCPIPQYTNLLVAPNYSWDRPPEVDEKWRRAIDEIADKESLEYHEQEGIYQLSKDKKVATFHFKRWIQIATGEEEVQYSSAHKAARAFVWYYIASNLAEAAKEISATFREYGNEVDRVTRCALSVIAEKRKHKVSFFLSEGDDPKEYKLLSEVRYPRPFLPFPDVQEVDPIVQLTAITSFLIDRALKTHLRELIPLAERGLSLFEKSVWITTDHARFLEVISLIFSSALRFQEAESYLDKRNALVATHPYLKLKLAVIPIVKHRVYRVIPQLEQLIGYSFCDRSLLFSACTHPTYLAENSSHSTSDNQTLEFVGDTVLGLFLKDFLSEVFHDYSEGPLTDLLHALSDQYACSYYAEALGLEPFLLLGSGEAQHQRGREKRLGDFFEALLGALFKDGGYEAAKAFGIEKMAPLFWTFLMNRLRNWKGILNEYTQKNQLQLRYERHEQFATSLYIDGDFLAVGEGGNWKEAEMAAAKQAVQSLTKNSFPSLPPIDYDDFLDEAVTLMSYDPSAL